MNFESKRLAFAFASGLVFVGVVSGLNLESGIFRYLASRDAVAALQHPAVTAIGRDLEQGEWGALLLIYGAAFVLGLVPAYALSRRRPICSFLEAILPEMPPFLKRPQRRIEPLLAQLGISRPIAFFGRRPEMAALDEFLAHPDRFLWWSMNGPGGVGKTRLAAEWMLCQRGVHAGFLDRATVTMAGIRAFRPRRETLIVADEALLFGPELWSYVVELANAAPRFRHKVRLLLIDWTPLADPPMDVCLTMESLATQALAVGRHYELTRQDTDTPYHHASVAAQTSARTGDPQAVAPLRAIESVEVRRPRESLAVRPLDDRQAIEAIILDVAGDMHGVDIDAVIAATEGNPLLIIASALHPDRPPLHVVADLARKMLLRAEARQPAKGVQMGKVLAVAALCGPIDHKTYAGFVGGTPSPALLVEYFALPRAAMRSTLPALEPELLAHEVILQYMAGLDDADQAALADFCFSANPARASRIAGNIWSREEGECAVALDTANVHLAGASETLLDRGLVLNVLARAAERQSRVDAQIRKWGGHHGLRLLRRSRIPVRSRDGVATDESDDGDRLLRYVLDRISEAKADYQSSLVGLDMNPDEVAAVVEALGSAAFGWPDPERWQLFSLDAGQVQQLADTIPRVSNAMVTATAIGLMSAAFLQSRKVQPQADRHAIEMLSTALCRRARTGPDGARLALAWAVSWMVEPIFGDGTSLTLGDEQYQDLLEALRNAANSETIGILVFLISTRLQRPPSVATLLEAARCVDRGKRKKIDDVVRPPHDANDLGRLQFAEALARNVPVRLDRNDLLVRRLARAAIAIDVPDGPVEGLIQAYMQADASEESGLLIPISWLATSPHENAAKVLRRGFRECGPRVRFMCFLALWARGDAAYLAKQDPRPDDSIAYAEIASGRAADAAAERELISRLGHDVHKLKAKDTTRRWAYYFVLVPEEREVEFLYAIIGEDTVNLEDYGTVLASCYGEAPTESVRDYLRERFGFEV